jgi:hypothetical protein
MFEELSLRHPERAATVAFAMEMLGSLIPPSVMLNAYNWSTITNATIVDVGGAKGLACQTLAREFPHMKFIVQDLESTANAGREQLPSEFADRITFMTHDFFTPQPVKGAEVYFFRAVFHDWSDKYCMKILQNLVPALKKGARIIIVDPFTPDPLTMPLWSERQAR